MMTPMFEYRTVQTVRETHIGRWIYQFHETPTGVWVKRTNASRPIWSHGVLVQIFDKEAQCFRPACVAGLDVMFNDLHSAEQAVWETTVQYHIVAEDPLCE